MRTNSSRMRGEISLWSALIIAGATLFCASPNGVAENLRVEALEEPPAGKSQGDAGSYEMIDQLTSSTIAKELQLQRVNASFRLPSIRQRRLRARRQFLYTETNAGCTLAANIARMALSYPYSISPPVVYSPKTVSINIQTIVSNTTVKKSKNSKTRTSKSSKSIVTKRETTFLTPQIGKTSSPNKYQVAGSAAVSMIGQLFSASGESYELSSNLLRLMRDRRNRSKTYRQNVQVLANEVDDLLEERERAILADTSLSPEEEEIARAEGAVLKDVRDLTMLQYARYHSNSKNLAIVQNGAYAGSIIKNILGASGNMMNIDSSLHGNTKLGGGAALMSGLAGAVTILTPILAHASGAIVERVDRHIVSRDAGTINIDTIDRLLADRARLVSLLSSLQRDGSSGTNCTVRGALLDRSGIYTEEEQLFKADQLNLEREQKQTKAATRNNLLIASTQGPSRVSQGILGMIGTWRSNTTSWTRNGLTAAGSTAYCAGTAVNIVATARARLMSERQAKKLKKLRRLPAQVVAARIDSLDELESSISRLANIAQPENKRTASTEQKTN